MEVGTRPRHPVHLLSTMSFNSLQFLIFFPVVVFIYFSIPYRYRWGLLLVASYYFYASWRPKYLLLIVSITLINYLVGLQLGKTKEDTTRKLLLTSSLVGSLGILFFFKYINFFGNTLNSVLTLFPTQLDFPLMNVVLPVGISFYTFQTLSYSIDVYRGDKEPEPHLGIFALYVSFFPQLVAGPIERSTRLLPQFFQNNDFDYNRVTNGLKLMAWGFFKKIVIADRAAVLVNNVYNSPTEFTGIPLILATYFFAFQIFCDFSAYTDIARGAAKVLGYNLMENFKRPYFSKSIPEFWRRWHISLSSWFRDYLYIPLGGNRVNKRRWYYNIIVVFLVTGLWHGAGWTFIIWGAYHGVFYLLYRKTINVRERVSEFVGLSSFPTVHKLTKVFLNFNLVVFGWIFFRANSLSDAFYIITHLFTGIEVSLSYGLGVGKLGFLLTILMIGIMEGVHVFQRKRSVINFLETKPLIVRWGAYYALLLGILLFGQFGHEEFIYFQF